MAKKFTREEIIGEFQKIWNGRYSYSKFEYINATTKSIITCDKHGDFLMSASDHKCGKGCPLCGIETAAKKRSLTTESFIEKAREVHGDKYDYSKVVYVNSHTKVCIVCREHGDFWMTPNSHLRGEGCPSCGAVSRIRKESLDTFTFIKRAKAVHGNKYDYSKVEYVNMHTKVCIICPKHGAFWQLPQDHLKGKWCVYCYRETVLRQPNEKLRKVVCGLGVLDIDFSVGVDAFTKTAYTRWRNMLQRSLDMNYKKEHPAYLDVSVSEDWLSFSNFLLWFKNNYRDGYAIDKDILFKGNKLYSSETCCCVPREINNLIESSRKSRGDYPLGVRLDKRSGKYLANYSLHGKNTYIGSFYNIEDAFNAYKIAKESHIKAVANDYYEKGLITKRVYDALLNYKIDIND